MGIQLDTDSRFWIFHNVFLAQEQGGKRYAIGIMNNNGVAQPVIFFDDEIALLNFTERLAIGVKTFSDNITFDVLLDPKIKDRIREIMNKQ